MRVLFLSPWFPYPAVNGSKIRIYHLLRELARRHEVHLVSFTRQGEVIDPSGLKGVCASVETVPWQEFKPGGLKARLGFLSPRPRSVIDTYSRAMYAQVKSKMETFHPDVLIASELDTARYVKSEQGGLRIFDDLEVGLLLTNTEQGLSIPGRLRQRISWLKSTFYIRQLLRNFDACTVVSEPERKMVSQVGVGYNQIYLIPNGVDVNGYQPGLTEPQPDSLIYNGSLTFNANYDAVRYFLEKIYLKILEEAPQARLTVTGSTRGVDLASLPKVGQIIFTGFVADIRPVVAAAWISIVPVRIGGGTRLKIMEAMASGTPVVSTSKGAEGLAVTPEKDILIADTPDEFARQVVRLFKDKNLRASLAECGRRLVEEKYSWEFIGQRFEQTLIEVSRLRNKG